MAASALQLRRFRTLWFATTISGVGEFVYAVAASWLMLTLTGSAAWVGAVAAARVIPILLITPLSGALADSWDRRTILLLAHLAMFGIAIALAVLSGAGVIRPLQLVLLIACLGIATAFNMPAWLAFLPDVVPAHLLASAVSLQAVAASFAAAIGPPLGGMLLAASSPAWVFAVNGLTYIPVFVVIFCLARPSEPRVAPTLRSSLRTMRTELSGRSFRAPFLAAACFATASGSVAATLPVLAEGLGGARVYGALLGISGLGTLVGAAARRRLQLRLRRWLVPIVLLLEGLSVFLVGTGGEVAIVAVGMFWAGVFGLLGGATLEAAVQLATPARARGRVMSAYLFVFLGALAVSSLVVGIVASEIGAGRALAGAGVVVAAIPLGLFNRRRTPPSILHPTEPEKSPRNAIVGATH